MARKITVFPDSEDLSGAAEALLRLQDTYALATHQIASGDLMGVHDSPRMSGISPKYVVIYRVAQKMRVHFVYLLTSIKPLITEARNDQK